MHSQDRLAFATASTIMAQLNDPKTDSGLYEIALGLFGRPAKDNDHHDEDKPEHTNQPSYGSARPADEEL